MTHKKLFLLLFLIIMATGFLLVQQIRRASSITTRASSAPLIIPVSVPIPTEATDPILGNPGAPLTALLFMDVGNLASKRLYVTIADFVHKHPTEIRLIWKDFPQAHLFSGDSTVIHQALYCANSQNKFWPLVDAFIGQAHNDEATLKQLATQLNLSNDNWWPCAQSKEAVNHVAESIAVAYTLRLTAAPILFLNNKQVNLSEDIDMTKLLEILITK